MSIEERFLLFDNFTKKSSKNIASCVLKNLEYLNLEFQNCIGQAGTYKGVQAVLQVNSSYHFSPCENHTLNLVGCDCAESCKGAIIYFGLLLKPSRKCKVFAVAVDKGGRF